MITLAFYLILSSHTGDRLAIVGPYDTARECAVAQKRASKVLRARCVVRKDLRA